MEEENKPKDHEDLLDEDVKKHSWKGVVLFLIVIVVVFSFLFNFNSISNAINAYILKNDNAYTSPDDRTYNGFRFVKCEPKWCTNIKWGDREVTTPLQFPPWELEDVPVIGEINEQFTNSQEIYITFDASNKILTPSGTIVKEKLGHLTLAVTELNLNLIQGMNFRTIAACTSNEDEACETRPIVTCNNTDDATIYFKRSDKTQVTLDKNCITIEGREWDLVKATDRLILYWYRVMRK